MVLNFGQEVKISSHIELIFVMKLWPQPQKFIHLTYLYVYFCHSTRHAHTHMHTYTQMFIFLFVSRQAQYWLLEGTDDQGLAGESTPVSSFPKGCLPALLLLPCSSCFLRACFDGNQGLAATIPHSQIGGR